MARRKKPKFLKLGDFNKDFEGWILNDKGIFSPEGDIFDVPRLRYFHWQGQLFDRFRYKMRAPIQAGQDLSLSLTGTLRYAPLT